METCPAEPLNNTLYPLLMLLIILIPAALIAAQLVHLPVVLAVAVIDSLCGL